VYPVRLHPFVAAVLATIRRRGLLAPADRVLVALSAGPDSTALLAALAALRDAGALGPVTALHVDHGLRPGGEADAACAAQACAQLGVPFAAVRVEVRPGNVQAEARRARYAALRAEAARCGANRIATGHTRTDQAETVLLRLLRGAGAHGLAGIPPRRGRYVRPLLDRGREEVLAFLAATGLRWREDPTNATDRFARNRVRHALVPVLRALAPQAERALARAADLLREDERALSARASAILAAGGGGAPLPRLRRAPLAVRRRVVRAAFRAAGGRGTLPAARVEEVLALAGRERPGRLALPGGLEARSRYGTLTISPPPAPAAAVPAAVVVVAAPGRYPLEGAEIVVGAEEPGRVPWPLELRRRRPGDRFHPEGGAGSKKLKAWLIDRKVPRERRERLWLVAREAEVLAIPELGARAQAAGPAGMGLEIRLEVSSREPRSGCNGGAGLL
jgi:tRNA(Ile)-lysidine synthase